MEFKKLVLIDPKHLQPTLAQQLPLPPETLNNALSSLDLEMKRILYSDLSDSEKVSQYNQILSRYRDTYVKTLSAVDKPKDAITTDNINDSTTQGGTAKLRMREEIMNYIPKTLKIKANDLLDRISNAPGIVWNANGALIVNDKVIQGTHIVDLVGNLIHARNRILHTNSGSLLKHLDHCIYHLN